MTSIDRFPATFLAGLLAAFLLAVAPSAPAAYEEGRHYRSLDGDPSSASEPVEVVEFFWYGCGACYQFLPLVDDWKAELGDEVSFERVPAVLNPRWRIHGQAYYTAEALGVVEQMHRTIFTTIHQQRRRLESEDEVRALFVGEGVDPEDFDAAWGSFAVDSKLRRAERLAREYQVRATPSMAVGGAYVSDPSSAGGMRELLEVTDELIDRLAED